MRRGLAWSLKNRQNGSGPKSENRDLSGGVDFIFGLAKNARLNRVIGAELTARDESRTSGAPARRFKGAHPVDAQELEPHAPPRMAPPYELRWPARPAWHLPKN
jgi:hypothetical protein